ncbi:MAG: prepilin-type N-terminal cleavage/methylation domain-containing protein [Planctomycetia bacterium]|nr:prepilin-type N-terminal cleavage/methylation domain-containing protein [Planctomycetia bacterium]
MKLNPVLRKAFTLMELLVVLVVLVLLAALIIPRIAGVSQQANSATTANILAGVNRAVQQFEAQQGKLPSAWDYVVDSNGDPYKLHPKVAPLVQKYTLTQAQVDSLKAAGITGGHYQDLNYVGLPHESIGGFKSIATTTPVLAMIKPATFGGHYVDFLDRAFGVNEKGSGEKFKSEYIVFGLAGPTSLRGNTIMESPIVQAAEPDKYYARVLCVFRIPGATQSFNAQYMGCFGPDGTSTNDNINNYKKAQVPLN